MTCQVHISCLCSIYAYKYAKTLWNNRTYICILVSLHVSVIVLRVHNVIIVYFVAVAQGSFGCSVEMPKKIKKYDRA